MRPVTKGDRIQYLDILRGIAILFIYLANVVYFSGYFFMASEQQQLLPTYHMDSILKWCSFVFIDGKFYSIFSILFGIGFAVQFQNAQKYGREFTRFFFRRMSILLLLGLIHLYVWLGDILTLYALVGFVLLAFRRMSNAKLLIWAVFLLFMPVLHWFVMNITNNFYPGVLFRTANRYFVAIGFPMEDWRGLGYPTFNPSDMVNNQDVLLQLKLNVGTPLIRLGMILLEGRIFKVLALFLIGLVAGRWILNRQVLDNRKLLLSLLLFGLALGIPANLLRAYVHFGASQGSTETFLEYLFYALGVVPLAIGYAAGIALIVKGKQGFLGWFAPVGKMALSNYLFQTVLSITLYYGIGFGLGQQFGLSWILLLSVGIFSLQVVLSRWWLVHFRFGPVEWIWRQLTYGKRFPIRRTAP